VSRPGSARWAAAGAVLAGLAVAMGAFGAHALRARLDPAALAAWETGARYQMYHGLALLATLPLYGPVPSRLLSAARPLFLAGTLLFSGSLYGLALTGTPALGAVTPLGGATLLAGWAAVALACLRGAAPDAASR
jgi:uncharacterized membrane protein YgdD (TMEM256/DUF423 family)